MGVNVYIGIGSYLFSLLARMYLDSLPKIPQMLSPDDGWMAGNGLLHWNGSEWGTVPSPVQGVIIALSRTSDGTLWAVTDTGSVLKLEVGV
jgi:hypothetical protein